MRQGRHYERQDIVPRYSFTQPQCGTCFADKYPGREPVRIIEAEQEVCCTCGSQTSEGIYVRVDPTTVPHPSRLKE